MIRATATSAYIAFAAAFCTDGVGGRLGSILLRVGLLVALGNVTVAALRRHRHASAVAARARQALTAPTAGSPARI